MSGIPDPSEITVNRAPQTRELGISDPMPIRPYKGELVGTVIEDDPNFIEWMLEKTEWRLNAEAYEYLQKCSDVVALRRTGYDYNERGDDDHDFHDQVERNF